MLFYILINLFILNGNIFELLGRILQTTEDWLIVSKYYSCRWLLSLGEKRSGTNKVPGEYQMDSLDGRLIIYLLRLMIDADAAVGLFVTVGGATADYLHMLRGRWQLWQWNLTCSQTHPCRAVLWQLSPQNNPFISTNRAKRWNDPARRLQPRINKARNIQNVNLQWLSGDSGSKSLFLYI